MTEPFQRGSILMHYDLVDLKVFLAVAEEGNLTRGAARCHLAPSSVSLRLKGLEEAIGTELLVRQARGVRLTQAGVVMLEHTRRCLAQLQQMHADLMPYVQGLTSHITFFANNNAISSFLPADLSRFFAAYPAVRINLEERLGSEIVAAVAAGRADIGIVAVDSDHPDLQFVPYREDRFVIIAPPHSALAREVSVRFTACLGTPFISLQSGAALHTYLMSQAALAGGSLDVCVQVSGFGSIVQLVASGAGISIVPLSTLAADDDRRLAIIELRERWALRHHRVCFRREVLEKHYFLRQLVELLHEGYQAPEDRTEVP
ncbi:LysR family transcriptional regulator [Pseudomonas gingeri]|uniref:LysR family transcriptional regulator n=1 Tax=Pseudomonas gingeri TaxID=117681 RepID=UPI00210A77AC|nr:LysR family transcriptional regulator [Pseudomonas gingeri]